MCVCVFMYVSEGMCYEVLNGIRLSYDDSFRNCVGESSGFIKNFSNDSSSKKDLLVNRVTGYFESIKMSLHLRKCGHLRRNKKKHVVRHVAYEGAGRVNNHEHS
jgi:hypothetical protein